MSGRPETGADNVCFLFMKSEVNRGNDSCSRSVQLMFRIAFKFLIQRSNMVQIPPVFPWGNHVQKENKNGTINS
jgi:hypothetical protein